MLYLGETLRFRKIDIYDQDFLVNLRSDPEVYNNLGTFIFVNSASQEQWFNSIQKDSKNEFLIVEKLLGEDWQKIGIVRLTGIDYINKSICVGADIHRDYRGQGFSKYIYKLIFKLCFDYWNMNRVWLLVMETNVRAKNLYEKLGFTVEGIQRDAIYREGKYHNYVMMSILKNEYKKGQ